MPILRPNGTVYDASTATLRKGRTAKQPTAQFDNMTPRQMKAAKRLAHEQKMLSQGEGKRGRLAALEKRMDAGQEKLVPEQCAAIQNDPQVFFDLPNHLIRQEHVDAVLSKFDQHITDLFKRVGPDHKDAATRLWSGELMARVLLHAPKTLHTEKMLVQVITGQAEPNRSYEPTKENKPNPKLLFRIFKNHPLITEELKSTLVKINPWVIFAIPSENRSNELMDIAGKRFARMGLIEHQNAQFSWLNRDQLSLDQYIHSLFVSRTMDSQPADDRHFASNLERMIASTSNNVVDMNGHGVHGQPLLKPEERGAADSLQQDSNEDLDDDDLRRLREFDPTECRRERYRG